MLTRIIAFSLKNKLLILLFTLILISVGIFSVSRISIGAVPDVTNNQVQVITTTRNLSTQEVEKFITYPVELEMANLPGVKEIRSVSKFGISVVTIVFEDDMGSYLPRQLIAEKIKKAAGNIPDGFGTPEMGPITTGLGEIYQYILDTKPGYEDLYSPTELRTIQDWIVKRQLSGIPGVVEINSWGGYLRQYEVAIDTDRLKAMQVSIAEVATALEKNNTTAGGGYIEKTEQTYFIRGEGLVENLADIKKIVVKNTEGVPVLIEDVASVGYGHAPRYGAITANGEGEKVLGQVMMLKNANSKEVIEAVKKRVNEIAPTLPEGVYINAFLDRSELIAKTTETIAENLILGCLIVIFTVVILLGNIRSGLVVASVIPLSLLFALSMMWAFDIDANLMSLGAIDFGIIIDGAVIIVEYIAFTMMRRKEELISAESQKRRELKDRITKQGAVKMMNSAIFGQLIILVVFIPVLSLSGVEGKMFIPMALTFSFALIGAMILCLTYVPVISSYILKPQESKISAISEKLMLSVNRLYSPALNLAIKHKNFTIGAAFTLLILAGFIFIRMGGEFVPTLDEGDFVIQPVLKTGTSLDKTIATTTRIEKILIDSFPEVEQVVTRIGAAEVPTDPMSMEESDVIITLKPKEEWVSATTKDQLAERFKNALSVIPGMGIEFTQPIEMRFNELITGVRADIAIKIFGEDLNVLSGKAAEIKTLIDDIEGAADITVEKIVGLPQMKVRFKRDKIARYGLNIKDLNEVIAMGFAGKAMGSVFEGEKRFDLVLRLEKNKRQDIENIRQLQIDLPSGGKIPLREVAEITYDKGAAKISRDETKRRIVVGVNVRGSDLETVVNEIQTRVQKNIDLPPGYNITYGGQFENLKTARDRLKIALPVALLLIFFMLYFALKSVREVLLIYTAIPLAAVGGVLLLFLRGMPFSISAGIGFIALFGIAVLNGLVLIEHYKDLLKEKAEATENLIKKGTKDRLRAVLLTASAAAFGFLPMAVSQSAGAEVQRPLATVVIGGLVTSTLLTLLVLPVLYSRFALKSTVTKQQARKGVLSVAILFLTLPLAYAQQPSYSLDELETLALSNNSGITADSLISARSQALKGSAFQFDKTSLYYHFDEANLARNNEPLKVWGVQQDFRFPTIYFARKAVTDHQSQVDSLGFELRKKAFRRELHSAFHTLQYLLNRQEIYRETDSLYREFERAALRRFELGETTYLESITATSKSKEFNTIVQQGKQEIESTYQWLYALVQVPDKFRVKRLPAQPVMLKDPDLQSHPGFDLQEERVALSQARNSLEKQQLLPDISLNYFSGTNSTLNDRLYGYQLGLKIPLLFSGNASKIKASRIERDITEEQAAEYRKNLKTYYQRLMNDKVRYEEALKYYNEQGAMLADQLIRTAELSFKNGEIDFFQYILSLENANKIRLTFLENLQGYNQTIININFLIPAP
ncbi:CusA/CzcA family heavy metal efflux RND transporter [Robertkochia aurantiaca]|uniref:CusA/CzcA family heavy metal efflux RND transporter n=1 Tax=Robertkochia aurantiaca TaxID=2873700 RepID=UPI001CCECBCF|nr:CusA/CzcA family heavy metal efflux RND transporter [Robertkochia sp. 3YJGBD-33]